VERPDRNTPFPTILSWVRILSVAERRGAEQPDVTVDWWRRARRLWDPVFFRQRRFRNPWGDVELLRDVIQAREWLDSDPCPDATLAGHIEAMLNAYSEMPTATVDRLVELRHVIGESTDAMLEWEKDRQQSAAN
jgi:hypothetical protein